MLGPLGLAEHCLGAALAQLAATSPGTPALKSNAKANHKANAKADLGISINGGVQKWLAFKMANPIKYG